jgi:hypothetical protein
LTGKFKPIHQVAYFDVTELLPTKDELDLASEEQVKKFSTDNGLDLKQARGLELTMILG